MDHAVWEYLRENREDKLGLSWWEINKFSSTTISTFMALMTKTYQSNNVFPHQETVTRF